MCRKLNKVQCTRTAMHFWRFSEKLTFQNAGRIQCRQPNMSTTGGINCVCSVWRSKTTITISVFSHVSSVNKSNRPVLLLCVLHTVLSSSVSKWQKWAENSYYNFPRGYIIIIIFAEKDSECNKWKCDRTEGQFKTNKICWGSFLWA